MQCSEDEYTLLCRIAPALNQQLGPLVVWAFTASFMEGDIWVSRMDYTIEGENHKRAMKSLLMEGRASKIDMMRPLPPRIFRERPSIAILREGLILMEIESPDPGERIV